MLRFSGGESRRGGVMARAYRAPWGRLLRLGTIGGSILLLGVTGLILWQSLRSSASAAPLALCALPPLVLAGSALSVVRGYTVDANGIFVRRLIWSNQLPWAGLREASADPEAMRRSIRTFGNGGLFSFSGRYWSRRLGHYRAFVTDAARSVVLRYDRKTYVLSPDDPQAFVEDVRRHLGASGRR